MTLMAKITPSMASDLAPAFLIPASRFKEIASAFSQAKDLSALPMEAALAARGEHLVILDLSMESALPLLEAIARHLPETKVLVISDAPPATAVRAMLKLHVSDIIATNAEPQEIYKSAARLIDAASDTPSRKNHCWVVSGAVGGAGATTLAIELACASATANPEHSVCLIDLNLADGMVAAYLEAENKLDLVGLAEDPERLDPTLLTAYCAEHEAGVSLISAARNADIHEIISPDIILRLLDTVCSVFTHVIVDMPRGRRKWSKPILAGADEVMVVSEFTVPSLHAAADMTREVDLLRDQERPSRLILNRMSDDKREFSVQRASKAIERDINTVIRSDWKSAREAVNLGMPVAQVKPKSVLVKDVKTLLKQLDPGCIDQSRTTKRLWR